MSIGSVSQIEPVRRSWQNFRMFLTNGREEANGDGVSRWLARSSVLCVGWLGMGYKVQGTYMS